LQPLNSFFYKQQLTTNLANHKFILANSLQHHRKALAVGGGARDRDQTGDLARKLYQDLIHQGYEDLDFSSIQKKYLD
jgi:3-hydroxyisobutyrate dehydrogenase-like beta-hydroxyacid dehydrogenase